jgi:hypothetical protein
MLLWGVRSFGTPCNVSRDLGWNHEQIWYPNQELWCHSKDSIKNHCDCLFRIPQTLALQRDFRLITCIRDQCPALETFSKFRLFFFFRFNNTTSEYHQSIKYVQREIFTLQSPLSWNLLNYYQQKMLHYIYMQMGKYLCKCSKWKGSTSEKCLVCLNGLV